MSVCRPRVVPIVLLSAATLFSTPTIARSQVSDPPSQLRAVDLGLPAADGLGVIALNRRGQVAAYTWVLSPETQSMTSTCWLYDNGVLTNLGSLGGSVCIPTAMNDSGQVVGHSTTREGYDHPFIYSNGRMIDIGVLSAVASVNDSGIAWGINSSGAVVGQFRLTGGPTHTFLYENGALRDIDPTALFSAGVAINDAGQITGVRQLPGGGQTAYRYVNGTFEDISAPGESTVGRLIDAAGDVAGTVNVSGGGQHAFLFTEGALRDLGTLGGPVSIPNAMNVFGQIAGYAFTSATTHHAMVARDGAMFDLGSLGSPPDDMSMARSINASGHVVGWTATPDGGRAGFFSTGAGLQDLATLLPPDSPVRMIDAFWINDAGQIAAIGTVDGRTHAFLLSPPVVATELAVAPVTVQYGTRPRLSATLTSAAAPLTHKSVTFAVDGVAIGSAITDDNGVAELMAPTGRASAGGHSVSAAFASDEQYASSSGSATITVLKAPLTVTARNATKLLGASNPAFAASYSGFVLDQQPADLDGTLAFATAATITSPVGTYAITPSGLSSPNYDIRYADGTLTITYNVCVHFDQTKAARAGSTIPIKLDLCSESGIASSSPLVVLKTTTVRQVSTAASTEVLDAGEANPDSDFRFVGPGYVFNLMTTGLSTGTWALVFTATGDPLEHNVMFQVR